MNKRKEWLVIQENDQFRLRNILQYMTEKLSPCSLNELIEKLDAKQAED